MPVLGLLRFFWFYGRSLGPALRVLALVVGVALVWNSARGLLSGEGMYNPESRQQMLLAGWLGIFGGIGLVVWSLGLVLGY